jgi:hypothetical protein
MRELKTVEVETVNGAGWIIAIVAITGGFIVEEPEQWRQQ